MPEVFPPLATYPLSREVRFTTRLNHLTDSTEYRATELAVPLFHWDLSVQPLSDAGLTTVQNFFQARGGAYESFGFLDPLDNLLLWSEDFTQAAWQKSNPVDLHVTAGITDPLGGTAAQTLNNTGFFPNVVQQIVAAKPGGITFTVSVWLKAGTAPITMRLSDGATETFSLTVTSGSGWTRYHLTGTFSGAGTQVGSEIEIPAGAGVGVFGAQMVAAVGPAGYTRTTTVSGFHPNCRFGAGAFDHRSVAPGVNRLRLAITEF